MEPTTVLIPFPLPSGTWSIARVVVEAAEIMAFVQSLAAFGVDYYPSGKDPGIVSLVRPAGDWQTPARAFFETHRGSLEIVAHDAFDASWRMPGRPVRVAEDVEVVAVASGRTPSERVIVLDPGLAFGDCDHPTTRMCASAIVKRMQEAAFTSLLDVGSGSGILGLVAARVGVAEVTATDLDPYCRFITKLNAARNGVSITIADDVPAKRFDLVVANIWATAFPELAAPLTAAVAPEGTLVLSGFPTDQAAAVTALFPGLVTTRVEEAGWCSLVMRHA